MTFPMETFRNTTIDRTISLFREVTQPNHYISIRRFAQEYPFILFSAIRRNRIDRKECRNKQKNKNKGRSE